MKFSHRTAKIIICLLLVMNCLAGHFASADQHFELQVSFSGPMQGLVADVNIYNQKDGMIAESTLLPGKALVLDQKDRELFQEISDVFYVLINRSHDSAWNSVKEMMQQWLKGKNHIQTTGEYSGEMFTHASTMDSCEFQISDLISFLSETESENNQGEVTACICRLLKHSISHLFSKTDDVITLKQFNNEQYHTITVSEDDEILFAVSSDYTDKNKIHTVLSCKKDGYYYFRDITYSSEEKRGIFVSDFYCSKTSSFQSVSMNQPMYRETLNVSAESEAALAFQYDFESRILSDPFRITGRISGSQDECLEIHALAGIANAEEAIIMADGYLEPQIRPVIFTDKEIINIHNEEEMKEVYTSVLSEVTLLTAELIQNLPLDYQKILISLLMQ